jgi:COP9 signalosome complex subunit 2
VYEVTLDRLKDLNNERLWFSMNVKLGRLYLEMQQFAQLQRLLDELYEFCKTPEGTPDASKATMQLDVYSLHIQVGM